MQFKFEVIYAIYIYSKYEKNVGVKTNNIGEMLINSQQKLLKI